MEEATWYFTNSSLPIPSLKVLMGFEKERKMIIGFWEIIDNSVVWKTDYGQPIETPNYWAFLPEQP